MLGCDCDAGLRDREQSRVLRMWLGINFGMLVVELSAGLLAQSTGLIGDSLDMLAGVARERRRLSASE